MNPKSYYLIAGIIFLVVALAHFLRIINGWEVNIANFAIPMWVSWVAVILLGWLDYQGLSCDFRKDHPCDLRK